MPPPCYAAPIFYYADMLRRHFAARHAIACRERHYAPLFVLPPYATMITTPLDC